MQLKWRRSVYGYWIETNVFDTTYSIRWDVDEWEVMNADTKETLAKGFYTAEEAMVAAHRIIEKELEKGYVGKDGYISELTSKLSYIPENMWGCKKALGLFTNENGDEYIDSVLVSATIPKGSLVREVDTEHHDGLPAKFGICRKCRSDRAVIVDILPPMEQRANESTDLPSRKTQRKKMSIISVHIVTEAIRRYFTAQGSIYGYTASEELISGFMGVILGFNNDARIFGEWLSNITKPQFPVSLELAIAARLLDPYNDVLDRYKDDSYMFCKVLLARILRDIGIIDIALRQSYKIGDKIQIDNFDLSNNTCGAGFHFFKTAIEAHLYKFN